MKIHQLEVTNFRGFDQRTFTLSDQFNVLIGENGAGKTAVLDALAIGAGSLFFSLQVEGIESPSLTQDDVRRIIYLKDGIATVEQQFPVRVRCSGRVGGQERTWDWSSETPGLYKSNQLLSDLVTRWRADVQAGEDVLLPLVAYYGTGRLWQQKREQYLELMPPSSRFMGYAGCLDPASNQKLLLLWFKKMELVQLQQGRTIGTLEAVKTAVVRCMVGWKRVWFDINQDDLLAEAENGRQLPFRMLSDGVRNMLAMVADIAYRAAVLNPHLGERAAEQTPGIVLIDEIDLHLHPKWQRRVVDDLRTTFPQVQFVATTHSPFIIQSLRPGELINLEEPTQSGPPSQSIEDIAEQVMGVEVPQRSERYQKMMEAAEEYYRVLQEARTTTSPEQRESLKLRLDELSAPLRDKARKTLKRLGLDKPPASDPRSRDLRWLNRREAWDMARRNLGRWQRRRGDPDIRDSIIELARSQGHWSVWMAVFEAEPEMRQAFIDAFPGTCRSCFDAATRPVPRPGGSL